MTWRFSTINVGTQPGGGGGVPAQPSVALDFTAGSIGAATLTAEARFYRNASKVFVASSVDAARFHCDTHGDVSGIALERASTGYLRNNLAFGAAGWTRKDLTTVSAARTNLFTGTSTAYELEETATLTTHSLNRNLGDAPEDTPSNTPICIWAVVGYVDMRYVQLMFRDKANRFPVQKFDIDPQTANLHTASPGSATQYTAGIQYMGSNRFLIWASYDSSSATSPSHTAFHLQCVSADGTTNSYAGTGRSYIVHGTGANTGYFPALFAVGDAHVSKAGDVLSLPASSQAENDFYVQVDVVWPHVELLAGTAPNRYLYRSGDLGLYTVGNTVNLAFGALTLSGAHDFVPGSRYAIALGKGPTNGMQLVVNGEQKDANSGEAYRAAITPGAVYIGSNAGADQFDGVIEAFEMGAWE